MAALNSKKICDCTLQELDAIIIPAVSEAFFFVGKRDSPTLSNELKFIHNNLPTELKSILPALRIKEIPLAFKKGLIKEFGEYYGLNVAEFLRFCKAHYDSQLRADTVKSIKPIEQPKAAPSIESQFYTLKNNVITAFSKNQVGSNFEVMAASCYDFLNKLDLIIFSKKEKYDIMKEAAAKLIAELNLQIYKSDEFSRKGLKSIVNEVKFWLNDDGTPTISTYRKIIAKSKYLTLKAFFDEIQESELSLNDLIDNKKDFFVNEAR